MVIDVKNFVKDIFLRANNYKGIVEKVMNGQFKFEITELSVTGNQDIQELKQAKTDFKFQAVDDELLEKNNESIPKYREDPDNGNITLEHLRLRTFLVEIKEKASKKVNEEL